ncbi:MAG: Sua5/YciO/YrdC/YwlC family protein [Planctomycetes bacterium]|jgi:carbamoyltransferase|nr:Sua5/YciO/YrdC/YwlC family protein [Planctomycetota bacterium]
MKILGIGGQGYRDSGAVLLIDGQLVAAASEERFTRFKHEGGFPRAAIDFCLREAGVKAGDLDRIAVANNPWLKLRERLEEWYGADFLSSGRFKAFHIFHDEMHAAVRYLAEVDRLRGAGGERIRVVRHHLCHLAEAFYLSPFEEAALLTIDGRGELSASSQGAGRPGGIEIYSVAEMPNSLGLLCASVADFLGFREEDDEFRIMSISSLGEPRYLETFRRILRPLPDGAYALNPEYFDTFEGRAFLSERFSTELGAGREPGSEVEERHADIAASLQFVLEEVVLHMARHLHDRTGLSNLCLSGGVAQNWVLGGRIRADGPFARVHTGFAPGDEGTALGAALHLAAREGEPACRTARSDLGPAFTRAQVSAELLRVGLVPAVPQDAVADAAARIAAGRLVGWFEGRAEFGPRALGQRSIFCDPKNPEAKERLVTRVKPRARYHPFGVAVAAGDLARYFTDSRPDPFMTSHRAVRPEVRTILAPVLHTDGTARVQTVPSDHPGSLHRLLRAMGDRTGHPVLLNTSLNIPGKPLATTVRDALGTFFTSGLDDLFLEGLGLVKAPEEPRT